MKAVPKSPRTLLIGLALGGVLTGCATTSTQVSRSTPGAQSSYGAAHTVVHQPGPNTLDLAEKNNPKEITVRGVKLKNTDFDFPITINTRVEYWVDYFVGRGRPHFERYLERSELFIPYIVPILRENGLPGDLVYLAMIESGFNNHAKSTAKAVGPWQFIPATGRRYGLMVNWWVDERRDTGKSTLAAVNYLRDLYSLFGCWELASAGYNAGEAKMARAVQRFGSKDFWVLTRQRFLRKETRDYVPKLIAAAIVAKNRTQFGFVPSGLKRPSEHEAISGSGEVVKLDAPAPKNDESAETIEELLADADSSGPAEAAEAARLVEQLGIRSGEARARTVATPHVNKRGELSGEQLIEFELSSPADLLRVAEAADLPYATIKALNPEILRWVTPPMVSSYRIKLPISARDKFLEGYNSSAFPRRVAFYSHKAKPGDTLGRIASRFGIKVDPVADLNRMSPRSPIRAGSLILLPIPNDRSRSLASLEIRDVPERRRRRATPKSTRIPSHKRQSAASISLGDQS